MNSFIASLINSSISFNVRSLAPPNSHMYLIFRSHYNYINQRLYIMVLVLACIKINV